MTGKNIMTRKDPARKIASLLRKVEAKFKGELKWTIGDYIRLLQAQQEFDREAPRDIEVTWVDAITVDDEPGE